MSMRLITVVAMSAALAGMPAIHVAGAEGATDHPPGAPAAANPGKDAATPPPGPPAPISEAEIDGLNYDDVAEDNDFVTPFAHNFDNITNSKERTEDWDRFKDRLESWEQGRIPDLTQRVRNLLCVPALMDLGEGPFESEAPLLIYKRLEKEIPKDKLIATLALIVFHPDQGTVIETAPEFDLQVGLGPARVRERVVMYAKKMLGRLKGKLPVD